MFLRMNVNIVALTVIQVPIMLPIQLNGGCRHRDHRG